MRCMLFPGCVRHGRNGDEMEGLFKNKTWAVLKEGCRQAVSLFDEDRFALCCGLTNT